MIILERGNLPTITKTCSRCGTTFMFDFKDTSVRSSGVLVECPVCSKIIKLKEEENNFLYEGMEGKA